LAALQWLQVLRENIFTSGWDLSSKGGLFSDSDMRISFPGVPPRGGGGTDDEWCVADGPIRFVRSDGLMDHIKHEIFQTDKEKIAMAVSRSASIAPSGLCMARKLLKPIKIGGCFVPLFCTP
jgi:hypothetical protein